jgi:hypothetical protein
MGKLIYRKIEPINFNRIKEENKAAYAAEDKAKDWRRNDQECQQYLKDEFMKSVKSAGAGNFSEVSIEISRG